MATTVGVRGSGLSGQHIIDVDRRRLEGVGGIGDMVVASGVGGGSAIGDGTTGKKTTHGTAVGTGTYGIRWWGHALRLRQVLSRSGKEQQ
jgi:hypothetical protein